MMQKNCKECRFFYEDNRNTLYTRSRYCFCRRKGAFFSRNYRIGEKTRIDPGNKACEAFEEKYS